MIKWAKRMYRRLRGTDDTFYVAKKPGIQLKNGDALTVALVCPSCEVYWADMHVVFGGPVTRDSFTVRPDWTDRADVTPGKPLRCPQCGFEYNHLSIYSAIVSELKRKDMDKLTKEVGWKTFGVGGES